MKAVLKKNQSLLNKVIKALTKYNEFNNDRDKADDEGNDKLFKKLDKKCEIYWDKYLTLLVELPKYEQKAVEKSDLYKYL